MPICLMHAVVSCEVHGPMHPRSDWQQWECVGFDGEGCTALISYEASLRVGRGETYWPGVSVDLRARERSCG